MLNKKFIIGAMVAVVLVIVIFTITYMMPIDNVSTFGLTTANSFNTTRPLAPNAFLLNGTSYLGMQGDGNLVAYINHPAASRAIENTGTFGAGHMATIDDKGTLRVSAPDSFAKWTGPAMNGPTGIWHLKLLPTGRSIMIGPDGSSRGITIGTAM